MLELSDCSLLSSILCGLQSYSTHSFESLQIDVLQHNVPYSRYRSSFGVSITTMVVIALTCSHSPSTSA